MKRFRMLALILAICLAMTLSGMGAFAEGSGDGNPPVETPASVLADGGAPSDLDTGVQQENLLDTLAFAAVGRDETGITLSLTRIEEVLGDKCMVKKQNAANGGIYEVPGVDADKQVFLAADGQIQSIIIERQINDQMIVVWAGVCDGISGGIPSVRMTYALNAVEAAEAYDLVLDMSAVAAQYPGVIVRKDHDDLTPVEGSTDRYEIKLDGASANIVIHDGNGTYFWAGKFDPREDGMGQTAVFTPAAGQTPAADPTAAAAPVPTDEPAPDKETVDWTYEITSFDGDGITMSFASLRGSDTAVINELDIKFIFIDADKNPVGSYPDENPVIGETDGFYACPADMSVPADAAKVLVSLIYKGEELSDYEKTAEYAGAQADVITPTPEVTPEPTAIPTPEPTPEATPTPEPTPVVTETPAPTPTPEPTPTPTIAPPAVVLNEQAVEHVEGRVSFTGTVKTADGGEALENWIFLINDAPVVPNSIQKVAEGVYEYAFEGYGENLYEGQLIVKVVSNVEPTAVAEAVLTVRKPVVYVTVEGYSALFDGADHGITVNTGGDPAVVVSYYTTSDAQPLPAAPVHMHSGKFMYYIKAEKPGCEIVYRRADGTNYDASNGYVMAEISIEKIPVTLNARAVQSADAEYNGHEQAIPYTYQIEQAEGTSPAFDINVLKSNPAWQDTAVMKQTDAGAYPIAQPDFAYVDGLYPDFKVSVVWDAGSRIVIRQKPITLTSRSVSAVYEAGAEGLSVADVKVESTKQIDKNDFFNGDFSTAGEQKTVGVSRNKIIIKPVEEDGRFAERQNNYAFDLSRTEGVLVMFPQSISEKDAAWEDVKDTINAMDYAGYTAEELPGFYCGMRVDLMENSGSYTGSAHSIGIRFRDNRGSKLALIEGVDYEVSYLRMGQPTDDLAAAGIIDVRVKGIGNYAGEVEFKYLIEAMILQDTEISIASWRYDGKRAGGEAHPIVYSVKPSQYIYRNEAGAVMNDAPTEAGRYTVQAIWDAKDNYSSAVSEEVPFRIDPVAVTVYVTDGVITDIKDESSLFNEDMIAEGPEGFVCTNQNFTVFFEQAETLEPVVEAAVMLNDWRYDGAAANSEQHPIELTGVEGEASYRFYDATGKEIASPSDVGTYRLTATFGTPEQTLETEFSILPCRIAVVSENTFKYFGKPDPHLNVTVMDIDNPDHQINSGDIIYQAVRTPGENVGLYDVNITGEPVQGNYEVTFESGYHTFMIEAAPLENLSVVLFDDKAMVYDADGVLLTKDVDYHIAMENLPDAAGYKKVTIEGHNNYTGSFGIEKQAVTELEISLELADAEGNAIGEKGIQVGMDGMAGLSGIIRANVNVNAGQLQVRINGTELAGGVTQEAGAYRFTAGAIDLNADKPKTIEVSVSMDGEDRCTETVRVRYTQSSVMWISLAAVLAVCAALCCLSFSKLSKQLRKERLKLLDEVSRQSNRTIREHKD